MSRRTYEQTERTRVRRKPGRGSHDRELVDRILDEALVCHLGFVEDGRPYVIPTIHARVGETLYLHGSKGSRALRRLADGGDCCVAVTLVDGVVLARSAFHHSLNYRSAMIFGTARRIEDPDEKAAGLEAVVEHIAPGRSADARAPSPEELAATEVLSMRLEEASAKVREGGPVDDAEDMGLPVWAGVLPLSLVPGDPLADAELPEGLAVPEYIRNWRRP
jgi:nitroimidazol reductase NimA-like FMN-containing flavoprotein (pyridoxamine 5'-phosphate oxidase superfamily)